MHVLLILELLVILSIYFCIKSIKFRMNKTKKIIFLFIGLNLLSVSCIGIISLIVKLNIIFKIVIYIVPIIIGYISINKLITSREKSIQNY